ncbi:hypothetical protein [Elizabethkingia anophelis]|uniref:hypothetical protein n=1 Tax=Elizabethkingia anophelis TaxID=1117645 RepID=UPI00136FAFDA|nr:hypothetical protein [Elizabethkingia anophelis]MCT3899301.1 hypothetical protein [Elizabethkingia anophelis]MCT4123126.1 hypothetical protein [Elizabethkingia anophelis]MCT4327603.1 hypothetical protein [Elizabethkingia anophelis]MYY43233.1 hypothetical protein [Elizabethkingia anophelis]
MITTEQESLIRCYLLDRKLTLDIAAEIYDHMLTQVTLMISEGESFEVAWQRTKISWNDEMKTIYDVWYSFDDITLLMKKIKQKYLRSSFTKAFPIALLIWGIHVALLWSIPREWVEWLQVIICVIYIVVLGYWVYRSRDLFKLQRKYTNRLSVYQEFVMLPVFTGGFIGWIGNANGWNRLYDIKYSLLTSSFGWKEIFIFSGTTIMMVLFYLCMVVSAITIRKYLNSIIQIKPFLQKIQ